jgi:aspartyl aminopeptidase
VDVGNPSLGMHSARELSGTADMPMMIAAMKAFLSPA